MKAHFVLVFVISVVFSVFADEEQFSGPCPKIKTITDTDIEQYAGIWYEVKRYDNTLATGECGEGTYEGSKHGFNITYFSRDTTKQITCISNMLIEKKIIKSSSAEYDLYYQCSKEKIPYNILDTDYITYSIVWGCLEKESNNIQRLFIYSRTKTMSKETIDTVTKKLEALKIDDSKLKDVVQTDDCGTSTEKDVPICSYERL